MTLLSLVQDVLGETGLDTVNTVVGTSEPRAPPLFAVARRALERVSAEYNWPQLLETHTFPTVDGTADYDLPSDFDKLILDTAYDATSDYKLIGGVTPAEWQFTNIHGGALSGRKFHITGFPRKLRLTPTPTEVVSLMFLYKTNKHAVAVDGTTGKATFTLNNDSCKVGDNLVAMDMKWRYLKQRGFDYAEEFTEARNAADKAFAEAMSFPTITIGYNPEITGLTDGYVPETGYGA